MANGGWEFGTAGGKLQGKIDWSSSSNGSSANTSNITAILYARRVDGYTTTGQSWSGYVKIQGKDNSSQTNISFDHSVSIGGSWVEVARTTLYNAKHNDDGSGSATVSGSVTGPSGTGLSGITSSGSSGITLDKIARYTSITGFSVDKRDETSFTFNWQTSDTIDYAWYSTNNGSNWSGVDVADGTSGSFAVTGLGIGTTYNCKLRVRRKDSQLTTDSGVVSKTTNTRPTSQVTGTSETTMSVKWTSDGTSNHIWYSLNNGSWVDVGNVNATTGTYTVSGLSPGTQYNVKTLVRKSNTSGQYESTNVSGTTYYYPHCTSTPNFVIGNSVTLQFYNPLNRSIQIQMYSHVAGAFVTDLITIGQVTQYTLTPNASSLYSSIPNAQSSAYNIDVWYNNHKEIGDRGNTYSINTSNIKPGFSNFAYKDVGSSALTAAIANDQIIVQGVSNVNLVISSANKLVPSTGASAATSSNSKYVATFDNLSKTQAYSDSDIDVNLGVPTGKGSKVFTVTAYDSRNIPNSIPKTIDIKPYSQPEVNPSLGRLNGFETATTFSVSGTFYPVPVSGTDKNMISSIRYRYKESSSSTWGAWTAMTIESQGSGVYQTTSVTLQCDNEKQFDFQFEVTDLAKTVTVSRTLSVGEPLMFLHTNGKLELNANSEVAGTLAGALEVKSSDLAIKQTHATTGKAIGFGVGGGGTNRGIWDFVQQKWMLYDNDSNIYLNKFTRIPGTAAEQPLRVRGIVGCTSDASALDDLHLGYGSDYAVKFGKTATTYVQASGMIRGAQAGSWVKDRDNSLVRNAYNGNGAYAPVICQGTKNGTWTVGCLSGEEKLTFNYETDTKYNNNTNTDQRYTIDTNGNYSGKAANVTQVKSLSSKSHSNYGTNNGYLPDMSFIAYWNGAYSSSTASNLTYAHQGEIQCKPISLYDNATGSAGTITLSQTAANFTYLEIFYKDQKGSGERNSVRVYSPNQKYFSLQILIKSGSNDMRLSASRGYINGTSITRGNGAEFYLNGGRWEVEEVNIIKVVGWK